MADQLNGWNVQAVRQAIENIKAQPDAGRLRWRSRVCWDGGFGLDVRTRGIEQLGHRVDRHFTLRGDHPPELLGANTGPTAVETLLAALGACVAGTFATQATARGIIIEKLEIEVEGDIDLNGFFGLKPVRPGLSNVKLAVRAQSDADASVLDEILDAARTHSPVFDSVTRPIAVQAAVVKQ